LHQKEIVEALLFFLGFYFLSRILQRWPRLRRAFRYRGSHDWPLAQATILDHRIDKRISHTRTDYQSILEYSYSIAGQSYRGSFKSDIFYFEADASHFLAQYPVGTSLMARVSPTQASDSMLILPQ
jgi:hypothetical protein